MDRLTELKILENEARRLRARYASDLLTHLLLGLDLAIRRTTIRVLSFFSGQPARRSIPRCTFERKQQ